jgi:hypothetical protein
MKNIDLKSYFEEVGYDWENDVPIMEEVCKLSKTRHKEDPPKDFQFNYGMEQPFFMKAFLESVYCEKFFEIGTGRGTCSMAASLCESMRKVDSFDILVPDEKRDNVINFRKVEASNMDILERFKASAPRIRNFTAQGYPSEINFHHVSDYASFIQSPDNKDYSVCFIDGDHDNSQIILNDYLVCNKVMEGSKSAYIIWDDYYPDKFAVKEVVDKIIEVDERECTLVSFRGHLFGDDSIGKEEGSGEVIMKLK